MGAISNLSEKDIENVQKVHLKIANLKKQVSVGFLEMGKLLSLMERHELFRALGYESFRAYLGDPDIDMRRSTATRLMLVYETFIEKYKLPEKEVASIDYNKLYRVKNVVDENNVSEWVEKAKSLSRSDLNVEVDTYLHGEEYAEEKQRQRLGTGDYFTCPHCSHSAPKEDFVRTNAREANEQA